jgi:hypothetical protein
MSWDEIRRAMQSEIDSACQALASPADIDRMLNRLLEITARVGSGVTMSLDVTGWSPWASRNFFFAYHDEMIKYLKKQFDLLMSVLWNAVKISIRKGGAKFLREFIEGMVQGWTGGLDSILHMHVLIWITDLLKREAQVASTMGYAGACVIDDALISFRFSLDMSRSARASLAQTMCDTVSRAYSRLGLTVAPDKMLVSTHVFHFLNRFFTEGSEIMLLMRTIMKVGADPFALIQSFRGQIDELGSTVRGAVAKGADPSLLYCMYAVECCRVAFRYDRSIAKEPGPILAVVMVTPSCLGGWGMMTFIDMCIKEKADIYRPVNTIVQGMVQHVQSGHRQAKQEALRFIQAIYLQ